MAYHNTKPHIHKLGPPWLQNHGISELTNFKSTTEDPEIVFASLAN